MGLVVAVVDVAKLLPRFWPGMLLPEVKVTSAPAVEAAIFVFPLPSTLTSTTLAG